MKFFKGFIVAVTLLLSSLTYPVSSATAASTAISESNYPFVAALARASILADQPVINSSQVINFQFENGVPLENQNMIKEGANNFNSHFGNILSYSNTPIGIIAYKTLSGGLALAKAFDPNDANFQADMLRTFPNQVDPEKVPTVGMGGFSVGYKRLVVMGAPYFKTSDATSPTYPADPVIATHELAHEVQASINKGTNMRNPVWLCEGGAQVIGATMSVYHGKDYWAIAGRNDWSKRIPANRTIADLKIMEGETNSLANADQKLSEYTTGAALSEYLIAKGGFANSLLVNQLSFKAGGGMTGFRTAFQTVYGQSLDDFYSEALPYINYVAGNWKTFLVSSPEALSFISERLGSVKAAETIAAAPKIAAERLLSDAAAAALVTLKKNEDAVSDLLPRFQSEGCHAGSSLNATLQKQVGGLWVDVADARGWVLISSCPSPGQYVPWSNADLVAGTNIRWHISATNAWDWYSSTQVAVGTSPDAVKAVAALKLLQISEAKAAADKAAADKLISDKAAADKAAADKLISDKAAADKEAADKLISDKNAVKKLISITCVKGKLIKKITAVKPTCPAGYKKK